MKKEALRLSTTIPVAPTTLYFAWLDSEQHGAMTGGAAKIVNDVGQTFTAMNGYITGKLITLDLGRRIIMSWRTTDFPRDATDSRVEVHFEALGGSTRMTVLHTDIPEGQAEKYRATWNDGYFGPMRAYFSKYLPDPRKPPPVRRPPPPPEEEEEEEVEKPATKAKPSGKAASTAKAAPKAAPPPSKAPKKAAPPPKAAAKKPAPKPAAKKPAAKKPTAKKPAAKKPAAKKPAAKKPAAKKPAAKKK
jgi:uncharacterized protein YndB with AHSA1/START domain